MSHIVMLGAGLGGIPMTFVTSEPIFEKYFLKLMGAEKLKTPAPGE